jgi:hypothetical protein
MLITISPESRLPSPESPPCPRTQKLQEFNMTWTRNMMFTGDPDNQSSSPSKITVSTDQFENMLFDEKDCPCVDTKDQDGKDSSASFLISAADDNPSRKKEFVSVLPPINRQLMDMLFNIVYITDDFPTCSLDYELYGYRQAREQYDQVYARFGSLPNWQRHFEEQREFLKRMEQDLPLTDAQKADPSKTIRYWAGPAKLIRRPSKSQPFLKFFNAWFYSEASAQAHLNPAGLFSVAMFLISEFAPDAMKTNVESVFFEQFKFKHFSRTLILVLAILSEIDSFCGLGNHEDLGRVWGILEGHTEEAGDVYEQRYREMLTKI